MSNSESLKRWSSRTLRFGDSLVEYARSLVGMANNQGGVIAFGIKDKPHEVVGLLDNRFESFDPKELNKVFLEHFSVDIEWHAEIQRLGTKKIGLLFVKEATIKPIVCIKNQSKKNLREGAIYYRYRGETKEIRHSELLALLIAEREKEKQLWMKHIQSIASIGPQAVQILDTFRGEMQLGGAKVLIDKSLASKLNVVKEGQFSEKEGAPTLRLIGDLEGLVDNDHVVLTETSYPHTQTSILKKLTIGKYEFQAAVWKLGLKGNPKHHMEIKTGEKGAVQKYTEQTVSLLREKIRSDGNFIKTVRDEYSARNKL